MTGRSLVAHMESELEAARRQLANAVIDFSLPDDKVLELRADVRRVMEQVQELQRTSAKRGLFGLLGL